MNLRCKSINWFLFNEHNGFKRSFLILLEIINKYFLVRLNIVELDQFTTIQSQLQRGIYNSKISMIKMFCENSWRRSIAPENVTGFLTFLGGIESRYQFSRKNFNIDVCLGSNLASEPYV